MLKNPEVQARAHAELDFIIGKEQLPTFSDMHSLPYIMIIVKEAFFWESVSPPAFPHQIREDYQHKGYHIPKGSIIIADPWCVCKRMLTHRLDADWH